jgi:hypothetical protein
MGKHMITSRSEITIGCILSILLLSPTISYAEWEPCIPEIPSTEICSSYPSDCPELSLIFDKTFSPVVGADLMLFTLRGYQALDDCLIPNTVGDTSFLMGVGRFGKFLIERTLFSTLMVTQHEVFGHGARAREFHLPITKYVIRPFSGATYYTLYDFNKLNLHQKITFSAGGMEANTILSKRIRDRWLGSNRIDEREASLYLSSSMDQTFYILGTKGITHFSEGHDVDAYISLVNTWYGKPSLTHSKLRHKVLINFLDPFFYYSWYSLGNYIYDGSQALCDFPMIPLGNYRYLPGARLALAPYGPEYQFLNFIKTPEHLIQATLRYGNTSGQVSTGATVDITRIWTSDLLNLDLNLSVWNQPKLFTQHAEPKHTRLGFATSIIARYQVVEKLDLMGQLGYKTTGFLEGETLKRGIIARIGLVLGL